MILGQAKNAQSGPACGPGGSAYPQGWRPPAYGRAVEFLLAIGREAPCGPNGRFRVCVRARRVGVQGRDNLNRQHLWLALDLLRNISEQTDPLNRAAAAVRAHALDCRDVWTTRP